jgi:hypothetical protein
MVAGVSAQAPILLSDGPPTAFVSVRQAVCDASRTVVGYEVLTGDPDAPPASARFSARALLDAFTDVDLDLVAPHHPAYLTVAPTLLLRLDLLPVAPDRVGGQFAQGEGPTSFECLDEAYRAALAWVEPLRAEIARGV